MVRFFLTSIDIILHNHVLYYVSVSYTHLPIVPEEWLFEVPKDKQKQFKVLCDLMRDKRVTELVCATDAGREEMCIRDRTSM